MVECFDFPWERLELEITETSAVGDFAQARRFIDYGQGWFIGKPKPLREWLEG
ncbi:hypothetical protein [Endothiovibrio diazotrophicus]